MEGDGETLLLNLQEAGSGPGGATAGNVDSGELLLLARCFSADLRSIFERGPVQLAVPMAGRTGLDVVIWPSPKMAEAVFFAAWRSWWRVRSPLQKP